MDSLYLLRDRIEEFYAQYSRIVDKAVQFLITFFAFYLINSNVGFMEAASSMVITIALSVICTFFKPLWTLLVAAVLILAHMYAVSLGVMGVVALVFIVMYVFFIRMTPDLALVVMLTPILFHFRIPYVLPVACGLLAGPVSMVAIGCGIVIFYMLDYVKVAASTLQVESMSEILDQVTVFIRQIFTDREMWIYILTFMICLLVVYAVRRLSIDHAWIIAIAAGVVTNIVVIAGGNVALGVATSYGSLFIGNVIAAAVGLILNLFFFSVDYERSENLQYEDDDYYYYVKAVPKLSVSKPDVTVKRINARKDTDFIDDDTDEVEESEVESRNILKGRRNQANGSGNTERSKSTAANGSTASGGNAAGTRSAASTSRRTGSSANPAHRSGNAAGGGTAKRSGSSSGSSTAHRSSAAQRSAQNLHSTQSGSKAAKKKANDTPEVEDVNETLLDMNLQDHLKMK